MNIGHNKVMFEVIPSKAIEIQFNDIKSKIEWKGWDINWNYLEWKFEYKNIHWKYKYNNNKLVEFIIYDKPKYIPLSYIESYIRELYH